MSRDRNNINHPLQNNTIEDDSRIFQTAEEHIDNQLQVLRAYNWRWGTSNELLIFSLIELNAKDIKHNKLERRQSDSRVQSILGRHNDQINSMERIAAKTRRMTTANESDIHSILCTQQQLIERLNIIKSTVERENRRVTNKIEQVTSAVCTITEQIEDIELSVEDIQEGIELVRLDRSRPTGVNIAYATRTRCDNNETHEYNINDRIEITNTNVPGETFGVVTRQRNGLVYYICEGTKRPTWRKKKYTRLASL